MGENSAVWVFQPLDSMYLGEEHKPGPESTLCTNKLGGHAPD